MTRSIEYKGHVIESTTRLEDEARGWTLEVRITPTDRSSRVRRCRAPNTYASERVAVAHCLEFGRRILDGKAQRKVDRTR